jgi:hypothetical protein
MIYFVLVRVLNYRNQCAALRMTVFLLPLSIIVIAINIINQEQDRQANAVPAPPTLIVQSATDMHGYNIPYNKLIYVPRECMSGTPNCPWIVLHGRMKFTVSLQNNNNPIDYLQCRLDGKYAFQANEAYGPCDANGNLHGGKGMVASTLYIPYATWSHVLNPDGTPYLHTFTIMAVDKYGQHSNEANWKWRTTNHSID